MKNELYHHGIDGQRWGVTHGPPYPLSRAEHRAVVRSQKATEKRKLSWRRSGKYAKRMSDEDLNATIDRLQREETYRKLVSKDKEMRKAEKKVQKKEAETRSQQKQQQKQQKEQQKNQKEQQKIQKEQQKQQKNQNKESGALGKAIKESAAGGIKTLSAAGFQNLAKAIWPGEEKKADVQYTRDKDGKWSAVIKGTPDSSSDVAKDVEKNLAIFNKPVPKEPESKWSIKDIDMDAIPWSFDPVDVVGELEKGTWDKVTSIDVDDLGDFYKI